MKRASLFSVVLMTAAGALSAFGQTPANGAQAAAPPAAPSAAPPAAKPPAVAPANTTPSQANVPVRVAVISFNDAVVGNVEGKEAQKKFEVAYAGKQAEFNAIQKDMQDAQTKLQTQDKTLSAEAKENYNRQIDLDNTKLQRMQEDAQKDLSALQQELFMPIAGRVRQVMEAYAKELGYTLVFDSSAQASNLIYSDPVADITTEVIRRVDLDIAKSPKPSVPQVAPKANPSPSGTAPSRAPATTPAPPPKPSPEELSRR